MLVLKYSRHKLFKIHKKKTNVHKSLLATAYFPHIRLYPFLPKIYSLFITETNQNTKPNEIYKTPNVRRKKPITRIYQDGIYIITIEIHFYFVISP